MPITGGPRDVEAITYGSTPVLRVYEGQNPVPIWPEPGTLYTLVSGITHPSHMEPAVYTVDMATGAITRGASLLPARGPAATLSIEALTWDGTRLLYLVGPVLYSLDPDTGRTALLHTFPSTTQPLGLAWDGTTLFAWVSHRTARQFVTGFSLSSVNTSTWALTQIGSRHPNTLNVRALVWDGTNLRGYSSQIGNVGTYVISRTTGAATFTAQTRAQQTGGSRSHLVILDQTASDGQDVYYHASLTDETTSGYYLLRSAGPAGAFSVVGLMLAHTPTGQGFPLGLAYRPA